MTPESQLTLTLGAMGLAAQLWAGGLPERATVTGWTPDAATRGHVRTQCLQCGGASLAVGAGAALLSRSWWPLLGVALIIAYLGGAYEYAARSGCPEPAPVTAGVSARANVRWIP